MDNNESNPLERIGELLEQYLNMFGQASILHPVKRRAILRESVKGGDR